MDCGGVRGRYRFVARAPRLEQADAEIIASRRIIIGIMSVYRSLACGHSRLIDGVGMVLVHGSEIFVVGVRTGGSLRRSYLLMRALGAVPQRYSRVVHVRGFGIYWISPFLWRYFTRETRFTAVLIRPRGNSIQSGALFWTMAGCSSRLLLPVLYSSAVY